jgi:hypothetical protein
VYGLISYNHCFCFIKPAEFFILILSTLSVFLFEKKHEILIVFNVSIYLLLDGVAIKPILLLQQQKALKPPFRAFFIGRNNMKHSILSALARLKEIYLSNVDPDIDEVGQILYQSLDDYYQPDVRWFDVNWTLKMLYAEE